MHVARNLFRLYTDGSCTHKIPQCHQNMEHLKALTQVFRQSEPGNCQAMLVNWQLLSGLLVIASPTDILLEYMHKPFHTTLQVNILHFRIIYAITLELVYFFLLIRYDYSTNFKCLITFSTTSHAVTMLCTGRRHSLQAIIPSYPLSLCEFSAVLVIWKSVIPTLGTIDPWQVWKRVTKAKTDNISKMRHSEKVLAMECWEALEPGAGWISTQRGSICSEISDTHIH